MKLALKELRRRPSRFATATVILTLIAIYSPSIWLIVAVIGATAWMGVARLVRGQILSLKEREIVQATRALGVPHGRVIFRHVLPNTLSPVIVAASLMIGDVIGRPGGTPRAPGELPGRYAGPDQIGRASCRERV